MRSWYEVVCECGDYILVGGVALNLHGIIRVTEDVDFFIRPTPENVERMSRDALYLRQRRAAPHAEPAAGAVLVMARGAVHQGWTG